jgi:hypothetical protein
MGPPVNVAVSRSAGELNPGRPGGPASWTKVQERPIQAIVSTASAQAASRAVDRDPFDVQRRRAGDDGGTGLEPGCAFMLTN